MPKHVGVVGSLKSTFPKRASDPKLRVVEIMLIKRVSKNCNHLRRGSLYLTKLVAIHIMFLTLYAARVASHMTVKELN